MRYCVRFMCLLALWSSSPGLAQSPPAAPNLTEWQAFSRRYVAASGRVIDTANNGISHSEAQGYGMFFAVYFDDRASFDRIWNWTRRTLRRPNDALSSWRYDPGSNPPVSDPNNATDGDIYIAWALALAGTRWGVPEYREAATRIATDILRLIVTEANGRMILLPAAVGFRNAEGIVVNLSYYIFPALRALSRVVEDRRWARLERDGLDMLEKAAFGRWMLPPDWLLVRHDGGDPTPAPGWPARFSWDALRVPLNLAWQGLDHPTLRAARVFWSHPGHPHRPPAWVDLRTGQMPEYPGHAGQRAVLALARLRHGEAPGRPPRVADAPDYYGASLVLQSRIAAVMPLEEPAFEPPEVVAAPSRLERLRLMACAVMARLCFAEVPPAPEREWQRPDPGPVQVRGVPPGIRGRVPPR